MIRTTISRLSSRVVARARQLLPAAGGGVAIEYGLIAALIVLVIIGALGDLGETLIALPLPALITALGG